MKDKLKDKELWHRLSEEASSLDSVSKLFMTRDMESFVTGGKSPQQAQILMLNSLIGQERMSKIQATTPRRSSPFCNYNVVSEKSEEAECDDMKIEI